MIDGEKTWLSSAWIINENGKMEKVEYFINTDHEESYEEVWQLAHAELLKKYGGYTEMELWGKD